MTVETLTVALWRQRDLLTEIHHQLYIQSLLLRDGAASHHMTRSTQVISRLEVELSRTHLLVRLNMDALAEEWGLAEDCRLSDLVNGAPDAISRDILDTQRAALAALAESVRQYTSENGQALGTILGGTKAQLADPSAYSEDGEALRVQPLPVIERTL